MDKEFIVQITIIAVLALFLVYSLGKLSNTGKVVGVGNVVSDGASEGSILEQVLKEITPIGTPSYGKKAGVSYDKVEQSLGILRGYAALSLDQEEQQRYEVIANTGGTACKYCCGASKLSQNCGCSHNIALQGLTKWLIKNTDYSNNQILQEIRNWQILFFPKPTLQEELQRRNIQPESVGLPTMRGGC
jgi:hypothetical protein